MTKTMKRNLIATLIFTGLLLAPVTLMGAKFKYGTLVEQITSTATSGGTSTLTVTSVKHQRFTGSSNHTLVMPAANTMENGMAYIVENDSTGEISVQYTDNTALATVPASRTYHFLLADNGTTTGTWSINKVVSEGTIKNADVDSSAAIARSKIASGTADHVVINDGAGALSSTAVLSVSLGGTGSTTATAAFDALAPTTTQGDIIYHDGSDNVRLAKGTNGQILTMGSSVPQWSTASSLNLSVSSKATTYTATVSDEVLLADASSGAFTITLPTASGNSGKRFWIKKDSNTSSITIDGDSSETIDGLSTYNLVGSREFVAIVSDGSEWHTIAAGNGVRHVAAGTTSSGCSSTPCTVSQEIGGDWVSSWTRSGSGNYTVNINSGIFSATPVCTCSVNRVGVSAGFCLTNPSSSTAVTVETTNTSGSLTDAANTIHRLCSGQY